MKARSPRSSAMRSRFFSTPRRSAGLCDPRDRLRARSRCLGRRNFAGAGSPKGVNFGATRIGVHAGPALVGNFGGSRFFDYTAYGDTINTAARLEAANKFLGTRICVSAAVADGTEKFQGRPVGDLMLRGRSEPLRAYEPLAAAASRARRRRNIAKRSPSSRPATPRRCRRLPRWSGCTPTMRWRASTSKAAQRRQGRPDATGISYRGHQT